MRITEESDNKRDETSFFSREKSQITFLNIHLSRGGSHKWRMLKRIINIETSIVEGKRTSNTSLIKGLIHTINMSIFNNVQLSLLIFVLLLCEYQ